MRLRPLVLPLLAIAMAAFFWWNGRRSGHDGVPAATWRTGSGADVRQLRNWQDLPSDAPIRLSFSCGEPRHVYVFSHSRVDGTLLLFPSPDVRSNLNGNPLPAGHTVLPGSRDGRELAWTTRSEILPHTTFVAVASAEPLAAVEALLPRLRRWTNSVLPDGTMLVTKPADDIDLAGGPAEDWPLPLLRRAAERAKAETIVNGPMAPDAESTGVWTSAVHVRERPGSSGASRSLLPKIDGASDAPLGPKPSNGR